MCTSHISSMLRSFLRRLRLRRKRFRRRTDSSAENSVGKSAGDQHAHAVNGSRRLEPPASSRPIRIATFNAAMFSMAPAVPGSIAIDAGVERDILGKLSNDRPPRPKSILKQQSLSKSKRRVSINLPEDEISAGRSRGEEKGKSPAMAGNGRSMSFAEERRAASAAGVAGGARSVLEVLREVGADVVALQNVRAVEESGMRPLSDLAAGLGMNYVFADSWAPEYGNAVLSRWPIKRWRVQKIFDDSDFRNVLKATIEVPGAGEVNLHCTHLDHLDESWRMKQVGAILGSVDGGHILAGGLNSLDGNDYMTERWLDIVKYYEEAGKPKPRAEVMGLLKAKHYTDAKDFAGGCEEVVVLAKGQGVQGTCKYGTRVDYILASPNSQYKFVPGSYDVVSSKGTSDHHIVKVDVVIVNNNREKEDRGERATRVVKIDKASSKGIWSTNS